jgi:hypothetical protein
MVGRGLRRSNSLAILSLQLRAGVQLKPMHIQWLESLHSAQQAWGPSCCAMFLPLPAAAADRAPACGHSFDPVGMYTVC